MDKQQIMSIVFAVVVVIGIILFLSYALMVIWNSSIKKAFKPDLIQKISYGDAFNITCLILIFGSGGVYITRR